MSGKLYIVPTPLGNLKDITIRSLEVLETCDLILCEDTRTSSKLLQHYNIKKSLTPYHQHNEHKVASHLVSQMLVGKTMCLITDAGTPGISDPGYLIVNECIKNQIAVECLPGATAFVPALVNSGLPAHNFVFEGFLPLKKGRQTKLKELATEARTIILYESPMRLLKTLQELIIVMGENRFCCVSRELTKLFEENTRGSLVEVFNYYSSKPVKGEIVLIIAGNTAKHE